MAGSWQTGGRSATDDGSIGRKEHLAFLITDTDGVARFEAGGTIPTIPVLERLANALGLRLAVTLESGGRRSA
jgi:hypothetical protein